MTDGRVTRAKSMKIGKSRSAMRLNALALALAQKTFMETPLTQKPSRRYTNEQLKARLIVFIGITLALVFMMSIFGILYALIFVTQPLGSQAPNDKAFIDLLTTLTVFLTGALGSVLASNGLKDKPTQNPSDTPKNTQDS
jgi:Na+/proline symporter